MATSNLIRKSFGGVEINSGVGIPDHVSVKGSYYIDSSTNRIYANFDGTSVGWTSVSKNQNAEMYLDNNTTATVTATNSWIGLQIIGTMSPFSTGFTYSTQDRSFLSATQGSFSDTITTGEQGFTDNDWVVVNGAQTNKWYVGVTGASGSGFGAYISNNNGASNTYTTTVTSVSYFYKDIIVDPYVSNITVEFSVRTGGELNTDRLLVYVEPISQTFTAGTILSSFKSQYSLLSGYPIQRFTTPVSFSSATQSLRIAFGWQNDASLGTQPPASVDNIIITAGPYFSMTYNGPETSKFRSVLMGSFYSPVATAIATASVQIAKNNPDENKPISSYNLAASTVREGFVVQGIFTMSSGDIIAPILRNQLSNISVTFNDLTFRIWEID